MTAERGSAAAAAELGPAYEHASAEWSESEDGDLWTMRSASTSPCEENGAMTPDENRSRVLAMFDEVIHAHDPTAIERFTTNPAIAGELRGLLEAFPDLRFDVSWAIAETDRVVTFLEMSGTHEGPFLMLQEGTHRPLQASILLALQLDDDGMVVDSWLGTNFIAMLAQLGWGVAPEGEWVPRPT